MLCNKLFIHFKEIEFIEFVNWCFIQSFAKFPAKYRLCMGIVYFKLLLSGIFFNGDVYVLTQIYPKYFKVAFWESFKLMLKQFGVRISESFMQLSSHVSLIVFCLVGWGCRKHWVHLWREKRPPNECSEWLLISWGWDSSNAGALWNADYSFIDIAPRSTLALSGSTW